MESLSVLTTPQPLAMEHWFEAALERHDEKALQTAMNIAERTRRRRFFGSLEFGGRIESLRWISKRRPSLCRRKRGCSGRTSLPVTGVCTTFAAVAGDPHAWASCPWWPKTKRR